MFENQSDSFSELDELQLNSTDSSSYFNSSWSEDPQPYQSQDPRRDALYVVIPITILYSLILVSGVVGNISTCIVISRNKHMHTATNYYLFSLAVSDLLLLISGLPSEMYTIWSRYPYVFGETFCILTGYAAETSANATVLTITAFTVERYVAICHPFLSHTVSKLSRAFKFIIAIWLLALCFAVPQAIQFGVVVRSGNGTINEETAQCTIKNKFLEHAFEISTCVFFVAPMTLITVLYVLIGFKLRKSRLLKRPSLSNAAERQNNKNRNHVIRMLIAVVVAFFICWAPFHAQRLLAVYASSTTDHSDAILVIYNALTYISGILYYLSTTVNPVLYHIMSNKFREAFKGTLAQLCGGKHKDTLPGRTYSMLSRGATHTQLVGGHRSSLSCGAKDIPLHLQRLHRQTSVPVERNLPPIRINTLTQPMKPKQCSPINVLAKRLRLLPRTTGNHTSIDSANTISNSSLQDLDDPEFTGSELAHYMGELNNR